MQFTLIHGPNSPGTYAILFFTAWDFAFTTRHIHIWVLFLLWPSLFIYPTTISLLFPSSILNTFQPGNSSPGVICFYLFIPFMGLSRQEYWGGLPFPSQWVMFCQNCPLWPVHPGWLCMVWLIASLKPMIRERLDVSSRKLEISREHFMQRYDKGQKW